MPDKRQSDNGDQIKPAGNLTVDGQSRRQNVQISGRGRPRSAVTALGGIPNNVQVGDLGMDGRIFPVSSSAAPRKQQHGELGLKERWYPTRHIDGGAPLL